MGDGSCQIHTLATLSQVKRAPPNLIRGLCHRISLGALEMRKISGPYQELNHNCLVARYLAYSLYQICYPGSLLR